MGPYNKYSFCLNSFTQCNYFEILSQSVAFFFFFKKKRKPLISNSLLSFRFALG